MPIPATKVALQALSLVLSDPGVFETLGHVCLSTLLEGSRAALQAWLLCPFCRNPQFRSCGLAIWVLQVSRLLLPPEKAGIEGVCSGEHAGARS